MQRLKTKDNTKDVSVVIPGLTWNPGFCNTHFYYFASFISPCFLTMTAFLLLSTLGFYIMQVLLTKSASTVVLYQWVRLSCYII